MCEWTPLLIDTPERGLQRLASNSCTDTRSHENVLRSDRKKLLSWPCTARCGYLSCFHCSRWCPFVMDHGLLRVLSSVVTAWHLQCRQGKPGRAGARGTTEESTKTQNPFPPFACSPLCEVATPRVLQTLLRVSASALPGVPEPLTTSSGVGARYS